MSLNIVSCLKTALEKLRGGNGDEFLASADVDELLKDSDDVTDACPRDTIFGYPTRPLYRELGNMLQQWIDTGKCPIQDLPTYNLLDEKDYVTNRAEIIEELSPKLRSMKELHTCWSADELLYTLTAALKTLGRRGLLDLLGMRRTTGTFNVWPPPRRTLEATFESKHSEPLYIYIQAVCTPGEQAKNEHAKQIMTKILDEATWINAHQLPHDVLIIEARQENGYGVRWTADGLQFRGFLEPQMVDGHEVGWRH